MGDAAPTEGNVHPVDTKKDNSKGGKEIKPWAREYKDSAKRGINYSPDAPTKLYNVKGTVRRLPEGFKVHSIAGADTPMRQDAVDYASPLGEPSKPYQPKDSYPTIVHTPPDVVDFERALYRVLIDDDSEVDEREVVGEGVWRSVLYGSLCMECRIASKEWSFAEMDSPDSPRYAPYRDQPFSTADGVWSDNAGCPACCRPLPGTKAPENPAYWAQTRLATPEETAEFFAPKAKKLPPKPKKEENTSGYENSCTAGEYVNGIYLCRTAPEAILGDLEDNVEESEDAEPNIDCWRPPPLRKRKRLNVKKSVLGTIGVMSLTVLLVILRLGFDRWVGPKGAGEEEDRNGTEDRFYPYEPGLSVCVLLGLKALPSPCTLR